MRELPEREMSREHRFERFVDREALPVFFRGLADALESGGQGELACVDDLVKAKIVLRDQFGKMHLKVKVKTSEPCVPDASVESRGVRRPEYRELKKRMKISFGMIVKMVHRGEMPPARAVQSFLADSALMVTYPGYGDEFYDEYRAACRALEQAFALGELERMHSAVDELARQKGHCHANYD